MIPYTRKTLPNGLTVVVNRDRASKLAAVNILYRVGARNENPARTGFAHLFEHLMFRGTRAVENFDLPVQMASGDNNAFTNNDYTDFYITLPKDNLETALWLESDRMEGLDITPAKLEAEKKVVIEEFRQRYLNQPYGDQTMLLRALAYKVHPYRWAAIGLATDHIAGATLADVESFYRAHYRPSNAILSISADMEEERMLELAEQVIGLKDDSPMIRQMKMEMRYIKGRYEIAMGEYDRGNSDINCSMALALGLGDDEVYLACLKQQIFCGIQTGNTELVEELVEHGLRCRGGEKKDEYATLMRLKGLCYMQKGKYDVAETMLLQALSLFEELDHEIYGAGVAACYNYLGDVYRKQDHLDEAMAYYGRALAVGESLSFMNGLGQIYSSMGQVHCLRGQYKEAMALLEKAVECLERNGYRWGLERAEGWLALTCIKTGDLKSAREHYRKGREISDKIRNPETERLLSEVEKRLENRLTY